MTITDIDKRRVVMNQPFVVRALSLSGRSAPDDAVQLLPKIYR